MRNGRWRLVDPEPDESLNGYLHRLAAANGFPETAEFMACFGLRYGRLMMERIGDLARELGQDLALMQNLAPRAKPEDIRLEWHFHRTNIAPVCPDCIANGHVHDRAWQHVFVTACPAHGTRLIETCDRCQEPLRPLTGSFDSCSCGWPYRSSCRRGATEWELQISKMLCRSDRSETVLFERTPARIAAFLQFLGSHAKIHRTGKPGKMPLPKTVGSAATFLAPVGEMLTRFPEGFDDHIRERFEAARIEATTISMALGKWYQRLMSFREAEFRKFQERVPIVARSFPVLSRENCNDGDWLSVKAAASLIGVGVTRLTKAIDDGQLPARASTSQSGHRQYLVSREVANRAAGVRSDTIGSTELRAIWGISKAQLHLLDEAGVLDKIMAGDGYGVTDGKFSKSRAEEVASALRISLSEPTGDMIRFGEINLRKTTDRMAVAQVFRAIFDGILSPVHAPESARLNDFAFCKKEVEHAMATSSKPLGMTIEEVASILGQKPQCVGWWARTGLLKSTQVPHAGRERQVVSREALSAFQAEFIPVSMLAKRTGRSSRKILETLKMRGIETHGSFAEGNTTRGHLVRAADLIVALFETDAS